MLPKSLWSIEVWRGVAALMVVCTHWAPLMGGHNAFTAFAYTGVDLFFVISGFVFAPYLMSSTPVPLRPYALRRIFRIYPAYLVALAFYVMLRATQGVPLLHVPEHIFMLHVQSREMAFYYSPPFWSLPAELTFYAAVPLLAALRRQLPTRCQRWPFLLLIGALSFAARSLFVLSADVEQQNIPYLLIHHLPGLLFEFWCGVLAWEYRQQRLTSGGHSPPRFTPWIVVGLLVYAGLFLGYDWLEQTRGPQWLHGQLSVVVALAFAAALVGTPMWQPRCKTLAVVGSWFGNLSYSVYLLHPLWGVAIVAMTPMLGPIAAAAGATLGLLFSAVLLHLCVERPARTWARDRTESSMDIGVSRLKAPH